MSSTWRSGSPYTRPYVGGEEAARLALRIADGEPADTMRMDLATHLIVRGSTAPPA